MNDKQPKQTITVGNTDKDAELIRRILEYKKEKNFSSAAATVRALCKDALDIKQALK